MSESMFMSLDDEFGKNGILSVNPKYKKAANILCTGMTTLNLK